MKIAFVRGPHLNHFELQCYAPLARKLDFYAIGANWELRPSEMLEEVPVRKGHVWGGRLGSFSHRLPEIWNRGMSWTTGRSFGLYDFDDVIGHPDILHSGEVYSTLSYDCLQWKRAHGGKLVVTVWENLRGMGELHPLRRKRKYEVLAEADAFLAVTETSKRILLEEGASESKIEVIPMGVNQKRFFPAPKDPELQRKFGLQPDDLIVLFIGRFVPEKGILQVLKVIPNVVRRAGSQRVRFVFVGAGPLQSILERAQRETGSALVIAPFVPYEQIPAIHNLADIFTLPSQIKPKWQEQFGHVLGESLSCGKPVVSTQTGSIPDVVGDAGILLPPTDTPALEEAFVRLLDSGTRRGLAERALQRARGTLNRDTNLTKIKRFYERLVL